MMSSSFPKSSISQSASQRLSLLPLPYVTPQVRVSAFRIRLPLVYIICSQDIADER